MTLTIVGGTSTDWSTGATSFITWVNKEYTFQEGDTVIDLLDAAVAAGDLAGCVISSGYLNSISSTEYGTLTGWNSDDYTASLYWSLYVDGEYAQTGVSSTYLEAGHRYQVAWTCYSSVPTAYDWDAYYADNTPDGASADTVTLTIVKGSVDYSAQVSYDTWVNKGYALSAIASSAGKQVSELTVIDLLEAAVDEGDIRSYTAPESSYGGRYIGEITSSDYDTLAPSNSDDGSVSLYWSSYFDGEYGVGDCALDHVNLEAGSSYQFGWTLYGSVPSHYDWDAYYADNAPGEAVDTDPGTSPGNPSGDVATAIDINQLGQLMRNIASSYAGTTDPWKVLALSALGMQGTADLPTFYETALSEIKNPTSSALTAAQRYIIALSAAGYDATELQDGTDTYNAIETLASRVTSSSTINARISALWAYASGDYEVPASATLSEEALINSIISAQHADGGFALTGADTDADVTAMAIAALTPYQDEYPAAAEAVEKALEALKAVQLADGGFADSNGSANACSTAYAIIALCAAGIDPASEWVTENGSTPLSALLEYAVEDLSGFALNDSSDGLNSWATEQGFMALVAYQGLVNAKAAGQDSYNLYAQAREHSSSIPEPVSQEDDPAAGGDPQAEADPAAEDGKDGDAAKTGDDSLAAIALCALLTMIGTFVAGSIAHRRLGMSEEE